MRPEIIELVKLGSFPSSHDVSPVTIERQEKLLHNIVPPPTETETRELIKLFGPDEYFGVAWTLLHLIESCTRWPLMDCLSSESNEWIIRLKDRVEKKERISKP